MEFFNNKTRLKPKGRNHLRQTNTLSIKVLLLVKQMKRVFKKGEKLKGKKFEVLDFLIGP